jgi:hypothetical protein
VQLLTTTAGSEKATTLSLLNPRPVNVTEDAGEPGVIAAVATALDDVTRGATSPDVAPSPSAAGSVKVAPLPGGVPTGNGATTGVAGFKTVISQGAPAKSAVLVAATVNVVGLTNVVVPNVNPVQLDETIAPYSKPEPVMVKVVVPAAAGNAEGETSLTVIWSMVNALALVVEPPSGFVTVTSYAPREAAAPLIALVGVTETVSVPSAFSVAFPTVRAVPFAWSVIDTVAPLSKFGVSPPEMFTDVAPCVTPIKAGEGTGVLGAAVIVYALASVKTPVPGGGRFASSASVNENGPPAAPVTE